MIWDRARVVLRGAVVAVTLALVVPSVAQAATLTVTTLTDSAAAGSGSLRAQINASASGDTIVFASALTGQITLTNGALTISHSLTIAGPGASSLTVSGGGSSGVFDIDANAGSDAVMISGLTITNGSFTGTGTSGGGGIDAPGVHELTLSGDSIVDNTATVSNPTSAGGGGVYVNGGILNVTASTISDNTADLTGATSGASHNGGGGVYSNLGAVTITGSTVDDNSVDETGGVNSNRDGGGGVYGNDGGVTITASSVNDNTATIDATQGQDGGGGVYSAGAPTTLRTDSIDDNTFTLDQAPGAVNGGLNGGGGVYNQGGALDVSLSSISDNTATVNSNGDENGGGAAFDNGAAATYSNSTLSENFATVTSTGTDNGGGAIIAFNASSASDLTIADNDINEPGGALFSNSPFELKNTILADNPTASTANCAGTGPFTSAGFNLESTNTCGLTGPGDKPNTEPQLGPLQNNGGPTLTQALPAGSPAVDAGSCTDINGITVPVDQRGVARPQPTGGRCDIGAYELEQSGSSPPPTPTPPAAAPGTPAATSSTGASFSGSVNPEGQATTVFFQYGLDPRYRPGGGTTVIYDQSTPPQTLAAGTTPQAVSASASGLVPNALYHVRLVASNATGTTFGPDQTFTTPAGPPPPPPAVGKTVNAAPVSGQVFVLVGTKLIPLTEARQLPSGAVIDAQNGTIQLTTATGTGHKRETGTFGGAIFRLTQARAGSARGLTTLSLVEGAFAGAPSYASCRAHATPDASAAASSSRTLQLLHASAHGKFATRGRYSAATVLGTKWTIADRCDGTLVHDVTDSVVVNDLVRHKRIVLHAGQSYLAKPPTHK